jgi:hypothetical protein
VHFLQHDIFVFVVLCPVHLWQQSIFYVGELGTQRD